ncbi:hypothetical protein [Mesorhizobium humile]
MSNLTINADRLLGRIEELGGVGRDAQGRLVRFWASTARCRRANCHQK